MYSSADDQAERASREAYAAKVASGQWPEECARIYFETRNAELRHGLFNCLNKPKSNQAIEWRAGAEFASSLADLCLWADRADRGRITWLEAKAGYEKAEEEARAA